MNTDTWAAHSVTFGELVAASQNGLSKRRGDTGDEVPVLRLADLSDGIFLPTEPRKIRLTASERTKYALSPGDLVCIRVNGSEKLVGRMLTWRARSGWCYCDHFIRFKLVTDCADPDYVALFFATADLRHRIETSFVSSAGQKTVNQKILGNLAIPLPPLPEQRRIVAKLDRLSARSRSARDHLARTVKLSARAKQAILAAAFRGELTADWRDVQSAEPWEHTTVGALIEKVVAGKNLKCVERPPLEGERGVVKVSAVTWGIFDPGASKTLPPEFSPPETTRIRRGDFLFSRANTIELVGACVIVEDTPDNLYLSDKILRLDVAPIERRWLMHFLRSPMGRVGIEGGSTGNQLSMRNISQGALAAIGMPWPCGEERHEIVRRIDTAFARIDRLTAEAVRAAHLLDRLDERLLAKAFRGELVPQDPADEPAEALLARIRTARAATAKPRRWRRARGG